MLVQSFLSTALLCTVALTSPIISKRDAAPVKNALATISTSVQGLTGKIGAWTGDPTAAAALLTGAEDIVVVLKKATTDIASTQPLPLNEATQVLQPGNALITDVQKVIEALVGKKDNFVKQNLGGVVSEVLGRLKGEANNLITAIKTKLPANVATVGDSIGKQINAALDKGIAAFK